MSRDGSGGRTWGYTHFESLYPVLTLAAVMAAYFGFSNVFGYCDWLQAGCKTLDIRPLLGNVAAPPQQTAAAAAALPGRSLWVLVMGLNGIACLAAIPVAFHLLKSSSEKHASPLRRALLLLIVFMALSALAAWGAAPNEVPPASGIPDTRPPLFQALEATVKHDTGNIVPVVKWTVAVSYGAASLLALTGCVLLWPAPGDENTALELARRMQLLRALLYFGTIFLVLVALRFAAEVRWAEDLLKAWHACPPLLKDDPNVKTLENLFSVSTTSVAVANTMILAAVYLPAAFVLRGRAERLAEEKFKGKGTLPEREKWMQARGLALSPSEHLPRIAAILAPLLAGPLGDLIGKLS